MNIVDYSKQYITQEKKLLDKFDYKSLKRASIVLKKAYIKEKSVFVVGNGGSASLASHLVCDFNKTVINHKRLNNKGFRAISLTDNIPLITAWSNDVDYKVAYSKQLTNLAKMNDILIAISSSGNSQNILECVKVAKTYKMTVIAICGFGGGKLAKKSDIALVTNSNEYGLVEDLQLVTMHILTNYFYHYL